MRGVRIPWPQRLTIFRHGWPSWLWWLGRVVVRHHDPFTNRWHLTPYGVGWKEFSRRYREARRVRS